MHLHMVLPICGFVNTRSEAKGEKRLPTCSLKLMLGAKNLALPIACLEVGLGAGTAHTTKSAMSN